MFQMYLFYFMIALIYIGYNRKYTPLKFNFLCKSNQI
nr:MAG TPA: hypothetical protein [Caudoviricetes sp.]